MTDSDLVEDPETNEEQAEQAEQAEPARDEYIEFVGQPPYGTEFIGSHTVDRQHMKEYHDVALGPKEVVWTKGKNGRYLVSVADMTPEAAAVLEADPLFRRVTLSS